VTQGLEVSHANSGARAMRAILHRQIEAAIAGLPRAQAGDEEIHEARKRVKAARATLRLLRPLLSEARYRSADRMLRDAARALSATRDSTVLVNTLDGLVQRARGKRTRARLNAFEAQLQRAARRSHAQLDRRGLRQSSLRLRTALQRVDSWPEPVPDWKVVRRSLRDTYRKGRRCARCNARRRNGATLHEWRKRAKYLRSQLQVIAPVQHASLKSMAAALHELTDRLGEEHDLAVLSELAQRDGRQRVDGKTNHRLQRLIDKRRRKLRKRALRIGLPLYAEKPAHFEARLQRYLREWQ
jgi:CHAD domain-containing protein